uniref:Secreted protein n=1 Tax=Anguilla anguilla TaxID=7936 RepID=A0A0E9WI99_ANGAN
MSRSCIFFHFIFFVSLRTLGVQNFCCFCCLCKAILKMVYVLQIKPEMCLLLSKQLHLSSNMHCHVN